MYKIGIIGTGRMGGAIAVKIIDRKIVPAKNVIIFDKREEKLSPLTRKGAVPCPTEEIGKKADIIIIAVEPKDVKDVLECLKTKLTPSQVIVSIAAGITTHFISKILENSIPVVRIMPNTPILVNEGMCALSHTSNVDQEKINFIKKIFGVFGKIIELPEEKIDAVTGLSGSGPAYVYLFIHGLIKGGEKCGLSTEVARKLAIQTVLGAAKLAQQTPQNLEELILSVATPGGTTVEGLKVLEKAKMVDFVSQAVIEATKRAKEISMKISKAT